MPLSLQSAIARHTGDTLDPLDPGPTAPPNDWRGWLRGMFPTTFTSEFAEHQIEFWEWVWSISAGQSAPSFIAVWPRGGGKSTGVETGLVALGARKARRYALYVSDTQSQADDHVSTAARKFESRAVADHYPLLGMRLLNKFNTSQGWRHDRIRTSSGFTVDALGLDSAARGIKIEDQRPDLIILDDIDRKHDSMATTKKKIELITTAILPAGSSDAVVMGVQNLIKPDGVFGQLASGKADFLSNRIVSGPHPALHNAVIEQDNNGRWHIVRGQPIWAGQSIEVCRKQLGEWGYDAFMSEAQHDTTTGVNGVFKGVKFRHCTRDQVPDLVRVSVWCDPAVTSTDRSDSQGIQCDGIAADGTIYRLYSWEGILPPEDAIKMAIMIALEFRADTIGFETDQGGDVWETHYYATCRELVQQGVIAGSSLLPRFESAKAGSGYGPKMHRWSMMKADYGRPPGVVHVLDERGSVTTLESALVRAGAAKPFDLTDAAFWGWNWLRNEGRLEAFLSHGGVKGW